MNRRQFVRGAAITSAAAASGVASLQAAAEPPPETTKIRLVRTPSLCVAPMHLSEPLLMAEGFTDVQYQKVTGGVDVSNRLASGDVNVVLHFAGPLIARIDAGDPITVLAGIHVGCFELFGTDRVRAVKDLRGKTVAVPDLGSGSSQYVFLAAMLAHVGLDPRKDVNWVTQPPAESMRMLAEGKIDAFLGFPPEPQELRAKKIGHVVVSSAADWPWSQYFCCMVTGNRDFVRKNPVATKRALRALLKSASVCALEPERVARALVDQGFTREYAYALQTMKEIPYDRWRVYNPDDTLRFYALRLHEAGIVKKSPNRIIADGTDWRFLEELKKELKA